MWPNLPFFSATLNANLKLGVLSKWKKRGKVKAFSFAYRCDEERQAYISAFRRTSLVTVTARALQDMFISFSFA